MKWLAWWLGPPSQERFAQKLIAEFRRTGNPRTLRYDPAEFQLVADDGAGIINLANIYREHCQLPRSQRSGHLRQLA